MDSTYCVAWFHPLRGVGTIGGGGTPVLLGNEVQIHKATTTTTSIYFVDVIRGRMREAG